jgi:hypothetical protein
MFVVVTTKVRCSLLTRVLLQAEAYKLQRQL